MIAGFESPDKGEIYLGDEAINELTPNKRDTAMVFQSYALLPHYNVFDNIAYGLKLRKLPKAEIKEKVMNMLDLVELTGMEERMTNQLSGGQQQRVALARALVMQPGVLLFDEPLSNLDAKLRVTMRTEIRKIQQRLGITAIYVTHDQSEAMSLSDEIILMHKGKIAQKGTPQDIYYRPQSEFVADFIGEVNFLDGEAKAVEGETVRVKLEEAALKAIAEASKGRYVPLATAGTAETTLGAIYRRFLRQVAVKEQNEEAERTAERYQVFLLPGLALLIAGAALSRGRFGRGRGQGR